MHPRALAERTATARERISAAVAVLAERHGTAPLGTIEERERRDSGVAQMRELELIADALEQVAAAGAPAAKPKKGAAS